MIRVIRTIIIIPVITGIFAVTAGSAAAELKIGYIRSDYIFNKYKPYMDAQKELEEFQKKEMVKMQKMDEELKAEYEEAQSQEMLMTEEIKRSKQQELMKKQEELNRYYENLVKEDGIIPKKQTELFQPILDKINKVIQRVAKEDEYDFVLDTMIGGPILYANETLDISDRILEELEKETSDQ